MPDYKSVIVSSNKNRKKKKKKKDNGEVNFADFVN